MKKAGRLKKIKKALSRKKYVVIVACAAVILTSAGVFAYVINMNKSSNANTEQITKHESTDSKASQSPAPSTQVASDLPTSSPAPQASQSTAPSANKPKSSGGSSGYSPTAPSPPDSFAITNVSVSGPTWYCASGSIYLLAGGITNSNSTAGGTFSWIVETSGPTPASTPIPTAFPAGRQYLVSSTVDYNGPYFSSYVTAGQSIRYRIVSPNNIASAWYTVPASASC